MSKTVPTAIHVHPKNSWFNYAGLPMRNWNGDHEQGSSTWGVEFKNVSAKLLTVPGFVRADQHGVAVYHGFANANNPGGEVFVFDNDCTLQQLAINPNRNYPAIQGRSSEPSHIFFYCKGRGGIIEYSPKLMTTATAQLKVGELESSSLMGREEAILGYRLTINDEGDIALHVNWVKGSKLNAEASTPNVPLFLEKVKRRLQTLNVLNLPAAEGIVPPTYVEQVFGDKYERLGKTTFVPYQACHAFLKLIRFLNEWESDDDFVEEMRKKSITAIMLRKTAEQLMEECRHTVQRWYYTGETQENIMPGSQRYERLAQSIGNLRDIRHANARDVAASTNIAEMATKGDQLAWWIRENLTIRLKAPRQSGHTTWILNQLNNKHSAVKIAAVFGQHFPDQVHMQVMDSAGRQGHLVFKEFNFGFGAISCYPGRKTAEIFRQFEGPFTLIVDDATMLLRDPQITDAMYKAMAEVIAMYPDKAHLFEIILLG